MTQRLNELRGRRKATEQRLFLCNEDGERTCLEEHDDANVLGEAGVKLTRKLVCRSGSNAEGVPIWRQHRPMLELDD
jgi:hypothetical protein